MQKLNKKQNKNPQIRLKALKFGQLKKSWVKKLVKHKNLWWKNNNLRNCS